MDHMLRTCVSGRSELIGSEHGDICLRQQTAPPVSLSQMTAVIHGQTHCCLQLAGACSVFIMDELTRKFRTLLSRGCILHCISEAVEFDFRFKGHVS